MSDEIIVPPALPVVQKDPENTSDAGSFIVKIFVGAMLGPKISPYLVAWGIPTDAATMTVVISFALHKIHEILKAQTGWTWL